MSGVDGSEYIVVPLYERIIKFRLHRGPLFYGRAHVLRQLPITEKSRKRDCRSPISHPRGDLSAAVSVLPPAASKTRRGLRDHPVVEDAPAIAHMCGDVLPRSLGSCLSCAGRPPPRPGARPARHEAVDVEQVHPATAVAAIGTISAIPAVVDSVVVDAVPAPALFCPA